LDDFTRRTGFAQVVVARLAAADAFGSLALDRRQSLWQALGQEKKTREPSLLDGLAYDEPLANLPPMTAEQEVFADYQTAGLSLKAHPVSFFRAEMDRLGVVPAAGLASIPDGRFVCVGGLVLVRQRPSTARGITFVTLEDETGTTNLIVRINVWERYSKVANTAPAFLAHGHLQNQNEVIHVLVTKLENLAGRLGAMKSQSRDFH
ncbi:MAG: error-prone DNA polymerase, partial [Candidatus Binatia bacterium]